MILLLRIISISIFIHSISGELPSFGSCPPVPPKPNFFLPRFMGKWYEYAKLPSFQQFPSKCTTYKYNLKTNLNIRVTVNTVSLLGNDTSSYNGFVSLSSALDGIFDSHFITGPFAGNENNYYVIGTDYDNYAVVYWCREPTLIFSLISASILTREKDPSYETIQAANIVLKNASINSFLLYRVNQSTC